MDYLRRLLPWIAFGVVSTWDWRWGAAAAVVTGVFLLMKDRRDGVARDALVLDYSTNVYFAVLAVVAFAVPNSPVQNYDGGLALIWMALTAWVSLAARRPFTLGIARQRAPEEVWCRPEFLRLNTVISTAWALAFTLNGVVTTICSAEGASMFALLLCQVVGFAAPAVFTARYTQHIRATQAAAAHSF
jgi:hypothetical protein